VDLLEQRGMQLPDKKRAERKLSQVGYYRLSGFWYSCRNPHPVIPYKRLDAFFPATNFDEVFKLYLFDKRLRLLLFDAIERIEVRLKAVIAHEMGKLNSMAYTDSKYIKPKQLKDFVQRGKKRNSWSEWLHRQNAELLRSKEDYLIHHFKNKKSIPVRVAVEAWSFGTLSKYFEMLKGRHQQAISKSLGVSNAAHLVRWLQAINTLRNRCAHHSRVWNQMEKNPLNLPNGSAKDAMFFAEFGGFSASQRQRIYVLGLIIGYLVQEIGPNSDWLSRFLSELENTPNLPINFAYGLGKPY